jgi:4-diphosphocytidyl-2-C-methyl-D-erythritol kinase
MELKANCKINLGLHVIRRRDDGYHDIETVMFPVAGLYDELSVRALPSEATFTTSTPLPYPSPLPVFVADSVLEVSGIEVDCPVEQNICMKALRLMQSEFGIGEAVIRLHKAIPSGAGLGGGSANAAAVLRALNEEFVLELPDSELERLALQLGSDVPFFIRNTPQLCTGRGEIMAPVEVDLSGKWLVVLKLPVTVSTAEAYAGVTPRESMTGLHRNDNLSLTEIVRCDVRQWRELFVNDFEESVFARHPEIGRLKDMLYDNGAIYASMSGSGSAVFGIFDHNPKTATEGISNHIFCHIELIKG